MHALLVNELINSYRRFKGEFWLVEQSGKALDPYHHSLTRFNAKVHHWLRTHPPLRQKPWLLEPLALSKFCATFIEQQVGGNLTELRLHYVYQPFTL